MSAPAAARFPLAAPLLLALLVLLLGGCGAVGERTTRSEPRPVDPQQAQQQERSGNHAAAARSYRQLAQQAGPPQREAWLLRAADNFLLSGDLAEAERLLQGLDLRAWPELEQERQVLLAEQRIANRRPAEAEALLQALSPEALPYELAVRYHEARAGALLLAGKQLEAARQRIALDLILRDANARLANQGRIIETLSLLPDTALELLQPKPPGVVGGWMELARVVKRHGDDPARLTRAAGQWRQAFPDHPAMARILEGLAHYAPSPRPPQTVAQAGEVALLLPLSGRLRELGEAIRDGLLAAYYADHEGIARPSLLFFDSEGEGDPTAHYAAAVRAGARLVIGPLRKEAVEVLAQRPRREVPLLALNWLSEQRGPIPGLYQFGLAPEDEAWQVADRAWEDGHRQAVILSPQGEWGQRLAAAFSERWERLGGVVPEHYPYDPAMHDFSAPLRDFLKLPESEARQRQMQSILGKRVGFTPRVRGDADFIFLVAQPVLARQLRPQLQFHHAGHLPIYATSHLYSGHPNPTQDVDLEGVIFPDIPWLLLHAGTEDPITHERLEELFPESAARHPRLYAMGQDLYPLLRRSSELLGRGELRLQGQSGMLYRDANNRIRRGLIWAQFRQGVPRVLLPEPLLSARELSALPANQP